MSSQPAERTTLRYRPAFAVGIVVLSIVLPMALACWSVLSAMRDKGIAGAPSKLVRHYFGSVKNGELWHAETRLSSNQFAPPIASRIVCLDLETGAKRDTGLAVLGESGWPLWLGETLYFRTQTAIFRQSENDFVKLAALPRSGGSLFLWEDQLTMIAPTDDGGHRLVHLTGGEWIGGRPILLPATSRVWHDDQQRGRKVLLPLTSQQPTSNARPSASHSIMVVQVGNQHHVLISDYRHFSAYRTGFEFADEPCEGASALAPENSPRDGSGWESICPTPFATADKWVHIASSGDGLLFTSWGEPFENVARRKTDGTWERLTYQGGNEQGKVERCLGDPASATAYTIRTNDNWGSAEVRRIDGNFLCLPHLVLPGCEREYLARWKRLGVSLLFTWWLHAALLVGGAVWLTRGTVRADFEFGIQRASLAPLWRRAVATSVDAALLFTAIYSLGQFIPAVFAIEAPTLDETTRAYYLFEVEQGLHGAVTGTGGLGFVKSGAIMLRELFLLDFPEFTFILMASLFVICGAKVFVEGRFGVTPGKWLLGLRTVRSTLRPCGVARAIVRNVLYCFDLPFLLTPLPAALSLMFSEHRQTLGDRAADTLVVRAGSIRVVDHSDDSPVEVDAACRPQPK